MLASFSLEKALTANAVRETVVFFTAAFYICFQDNFLFYSHIFGCSVKQPLLPP